MSSSSDIAIEIEQISKTYSGGICALDQVSFEVKKGEFFALLGPNGAGKTTLISCLAGLARQSSGTIKVMGYDTQREAYQARMNLGVVPQELVFDPFFTVKETLRFQSGYFGIKNNENWQNEILEKLGLADKANANTRALSGGMKRRLMVAQALVHKPPVIVLDEPTAGVDVELRQNLWAFVQELNQQGHTIVLTTHYLEEAQTLCNRIARLKKGQLITLDDKEKLLSLGAGVLLWLQLSSDVCPDCIKPVFLRNHDNGFVLQLDDYAQIGKILHQLNEEGIVINKMQILEKDLEEVFLQKTHDAGVERA